MHYESQKNKKYNKLQFLRYFATYTQPTHYVLHPKFKRTYTHKNDKKLEA